jgi:hypothetical protein
MDHKYDASDSDEIEALLRRAKEGNVITQFDTGRGLCLWFSGAPGGELRKLRKAIKALLPANWISKKHEYYHH